MAGCCSPKTSLSPHSLETPVGRYTWCIPFCGLDQSSGVPLISVGRIRSRLDEQSDLFPSFGIQLDSKSLKNCKGVSPSSSDARAPARIISSEQSF